MTKTNEYFYSLIYINYLLIEDIYKGLVILDGYELRLWDP